MIEHQGVILWFTGSPGVDIAKIAQELVKKLHSYGAKVCLFDDENMGLPHFNENLVNEEEQTRYLKIVANTANILKTDKYITIIALKDFSTKEESKNILRKVGAINVFIDSSSGSFLDESKEILEIQEKPMINFQIYQDKPEKQVQKIYNFLVERGYVDEIGNYLDNIYKPNSFEKVFTKFPFSSLFLFRSQIKKSPKKAFKSLVDDTLLFFKFRRYSYKNKVIFIAGLPKSGTTWLKNILATIPGYHDRPIYDPSRAPFFHDVTPLTFDLIPSYSYSVVKLHTKYTPYNFQTIKNKIGKWIVLFRDPRDMCISRYYHMLNLKSHRHYGLYHSLGLEKSLFHCINIVKNEYIDWIQNWHLAYLRNKDKILELRYEDLNKNFKNSMNKVLNFLEIPHNETFIEKLQSTQLKKPVNVKESIAKGDTKRKGIVGDWKNHFTEEHKDYFKEIAGDLLIELGYEKDYSW